MTNAELITELQKQDSTAKLIIGLYEPSNLGTRILTGELSHLAEGIATKCITIMGTVAHSGLVHPDPSEPPA